VIIWINGTFGAGKTATADQLVPLLDNTRVFDPELVGYMMRGCLADHRVDDFQDWPAWRRLVIETATAIASATGQDIIAVQSVLSADYWTEIREGLLERGLDVFHVLLTADTERLRHRIESDEDKDAREWRLGHLGEMEAALPWMREAADLVVDTSSRSAAQAAALIASSLPREST